MIGEPHKRCVGSNEAFRQLPDRTPPIQPVATAATTTKRHSHGTEPAKGRCSSLDLTMLARRGENVHADSSLLDVAGALEALPELLVEAPRQASLVQEVTRAETFWSFAQVALRYRVTSTLGRDFLSCPTPASVTFVSSRSSR